MKTNNNKMTTYLLTGIFCIAFTLVLNSFIGVSGSYYSRYLLLIGIVIAAVIGGPILGVVVVIGSLILDFIKNVILLAGWGDMAATLWSATSGHIYVGFILAIAIGVLGKKFTKSFNKAIIIAVIVSVVSVLLCLIVIEPVWMGIWGLWMVDLREGYMSSYFSGEIFSDFITFVIHVASITGVCLISYGILKLLPKSFQEKYYGTGVFCKK